MVSETVMKFRAVLIATFLILLAVSFNIAAQQNPVKPSPKDKCPVCGMFVAKSPDWVGEIIFRDGSVAFFDGAKDLFKYYLNLKKYNPNLTTADVGAIYVTEYYNLKMIDGYTALFVIGSDVYGPMGRELIPFETLDDARSFMKDHKGERILRFKNVRARLLKKLD